MESGDISVSVTTGKELNVRGIRRLLILLLILQQDCSHICEICSGQKSYTYPQIIYEVTV
jgi:hypothetical protein